MKDICSYPSNELTANRLKRHIADSLKQTGFALELGKQTR